ncbi:MAG: N-formylglutamate amidohydrolase [Bdellovibrionaceae bacterium]|nr:N-formylglutamate amidohydrolase [Pseudobdellovibrionaceae bacterium]MBX3033488.1 N-formylglutamate amidohydrolase [Pseudobdellovibrionaceae bacterium]
MSSIPFLVSIPHSGEKVPPQAPWLNGLPEDLLMCDVDRYVDRLYEPALNELKIPFVKTEWHRYAGDLNRLPEDVDASSVEGDPHPAGQFNRGFLWTITTTERPLMTKPISPATHQELVELIYEPFHASIRHLYEKFRQEGHKVVYHLDAHSMPSVGTRQHRDPGERRADIVVSDCQGLSCSAAYRDLVIAAYCVAGFKVAYNWPYLGGRVTETYGLPAQGQEALQVEMNRDLYMDEVTKRYRPEAAAKVQAKVKKALGLIFSHLPLVMNSKKS